MADLYGMAQGPAFDPVESFFAGRDTRARDQFNKNKLAELARMDAARPLMGKAVMGDQNALAGLAQYDPQSALDVKKVAISQQNADRETQQKEYDRIAGVLTAADTPEKWGQAIQFLEAQGAEISPQERDFNNRAFVIAQGGTEAQKLGLKPRTQVVGVGNRQKLVNLNDGSVIADLGPANNAGGGGQNAPSGYRWTQDQNLEPIPGGPQDPRNKASRGNGGITTKMQNDAVAVEQAYNNLDSALADYESLIKQTGVSVLPGQENDAIRQSRTNLQLQLKELYNLGVLNGPDLSLMQDMIFDPQISITSPIDAAGKIYSAVGGPKASSIGDRATASIARVRGMLKTIRDNKTKGILDEKGQLVRPQPDQGSAPDPQAAPEQGADAPQGGTQFDPNNPTFDQQDVEMLAADPSPENRAYFDEAFGPGAADYVLGAQ